MVKLCDCVSVITDPDNSDNSLGECHQSGNVTCLLFVTTYVAFGINS